MENLSKSFETASFGRLPAVDNVSFEIKPGEIFGLVGESGCGKTTLARLILKLIQPDAGAVYYRGENIFSLDHSAIRGLRRKIQIIFQNPYASLNPRFKIGPAIEEPLLIQKNCPPKEARERAGAMLKSVGLAADDYNKFPHQFSAGQRQRVAIARSLILQPEFLVLDEPVSSLDVTVQKQILELLLEIKNNFNLTFLFITHDIKIISNLAGSLAVMKNGQLVEVGATSEILSHPRHEYTRSLLEFVI